MTDKKILFVAGATGAQGGAVIDALEGGEFTLRALVRDPSSAAAQALAARGVELIQGDFDDSESLERGVKGAYGVFSVQMPPAMDDLEREARTARKLVDAARNNGVEIFVHTSVARAGDHESFVGWAERRWWPDYWLSKDAANQAVRAAGFPHWVILKPALMMDNLVAPRSYWMYPGLKSRATFETAFAPDTRLHFIAAADVGRFAAAAFADPARFDRQEIDLAAEALTMSEIAQAVSGATGKPVTAQHFSGEEAVKMGNPPGLTESQEWANVEGYKVDTEKANSHGIALERLSDWARRMRDRFDID
ncbi:NmrA family NAD(P)-binding protein [Sphingobium sp. JS3065]|uniref:NmrA family NAD(P)-binding protein n=1 Tax=Sphingobium sp. JS3065 TaxID=2970925 RepID=UPI002264F2F2|nr:NmrA family NAD(P)-binding protein [Sphingobium sp. JS3065]UZW57417.1 NmrA family NAD(P)-binding protein [Sphingobium sp. JS3065]